MTILLYAQCSINAELNLMQIKRIVLFSRRRIYERMAASVY